MLSHDEEYREALYDCGVRYADMMFNEDEDEDEDENDDALERFIAEFKDGCINGLPVAKLCRWLGYIQGVLIERGITTVETERDWTRPLFRPLDFP